MIHDRHVSDERIRWVLDIVQDPDSRKLDRLAPWYANRKAKAALERIAGDPPRAPGDLHLVGLPFTLESLRRYGATGDRESLELESGKSADRNRRWVLAAIEMIWSDERLRLRLNKCDECRRIYLRGIASRSKPTYCSLTCRERKRYEPTNPRTFRRRSYTPIPLKTRYPGDT